MDTLTEPEAWHDPNVDGPVSLREGLGLDIVAHVPPDQRPTTALRWIGKGLGIVLFSSGFHMTMVYRLAHASRYRFGIVGRAFSAAGFWWGRHFYGCSIAPTARIFGGLILPHPQGIVIGASTVIGPRAWIFQNVTIGGAPGKIGMPKIGADARIYAGAVITGPVHLGENVMVGANVVVSRDVPSRVVLRPSVVEFSPLPSQFEVE